MRYRFIQEHRQQFPVAALCRVLQVSTSGYYAWRAPPREPRGGERTGRCWRRSRRRTRAAARPTGGAAIHAQLQQQRRRLLAQPGGPPDAPGRPLWAAQTSFQSHHRLQAQLPGGAESAGARLHRHRARPGVGERHHLPGLRGRLGLSGDGDGPVLPADRGLGDAVHPGAQPDAEGVGDGDRAAPARPRADSPLGSGQPVRLRGLPGGAAAARDAAQHVAARATAGTTPPRRVSSARSKCELGHHWAPAAPRARRAGRCSSTSKSSTTGSGCTRRWGTCPRPPSRRSPLPRQPNKVSTFSGPDHLLRPGARWLPMAGVQTRPARACSLPLRSGATRSWPRDGLLARHTVAIRS